jgi:hypothetical protein
VENFFIISQALGVLQKVKNCRSDLILFSDGLLNKLNISITEENFIDKLLQSIVTTNHGGHLLGVYKGQRSQKEQRTKHHEHGVNVFPLFSFIFSSENLIHNALNVDL